MKNIIALLVLVFSATAASAQCAIYVSDNGPWWAEYRADAEPARAVDDMKKVALAKCSEKGTNCHLLYASNEGGWWGLITGYRNDGRIMWEAVYGQSSESGARENLKTLYRRHNGTDIGNARIEVWHVKGM